MAFGPSAQRLEGDRENHQRRRREQVPKYLSSFAYEDATEKGERDFAVLATDFLQDDVDVVIGESKTSRALDQEERDAIRRIGGRTNVYLAFCTQSSDFQESD
jgi:hypothetical protein